MLRRKESRAPGESSLLTAILDGMASPTLVYADPAPYNDVGLPHDISESFAAVGKTIGEAMGQVERDVAARDRR